MEAELRISLLGTPQVSLGGRPLKFVRRRAEALLVYLAISGRVHTRDALAMLLAGETDDQRARKHLRNALVEVTASVGDYLIVTPRTIAFDRTHPYWIDVSEFEDAVGSVEDPWRLQAAVALHQDEFMAGFAMPDAPAFDDWLLLERERLRDQLILALQSLIAWHVQRGDTVAGITCARQLLAMEPWSEEAHRGLMLLLARGGQRGAALAQYTICRRVLGDELGVEPTPETTALYQRLSTAPAVVRHNLPAEGAPLVGRTKELRELRGRLGDPGCRLITILGLGGSGKTRLALRAAWSFAAPTAALDEDAVPDGLFLVDLAGADGPLAETIARACGLRLTDQGDPREQLLAWLAPRGLVLILDCGEQPPSETNLLGEILRRAPRVTILVTARTRLQLRGEWVLELAGLPVPAGPEQVELSPAAQLFLQRAGQVEPIRALAPSDYPAVARICQLTDGLPLALLLAADLLRALSCDELGAKLAGSLDLLTSTLRDMPERQRSVRVVVAEAAASLASDERAILRRLAVFSGPFDQETAAAVTLATPLHLLALRDSGLLGREEEGRYRLPELVRRYAAERLAARPYEAAQAYAQHATHFSALLARRADTIAQDPRVAQAIAAEIDDVRAAWAWSSDHVALDLLAGLCAGLARWCDLTGRYREWADLFGRAVRDLRAALDVASTPEADLRLMLAALLTERARAVLGLGRCDEAQALLDEAEGWLVATEAPVEQARLAHYRGLALQARGDVDAAWHQFALARDRSEATGLLDLVAANCAAQGRSAIAAGDYCQAQLLCERARVIFRQLGDRPGMGSATLALGQIAAEQGNVDRARQHYAAALDAARAFGHRRGEIAALCALGLLACEQLRDHDEAATHFAEARRLARDIDDRSGAAEIGAYQGRNALLAGDFDRAEAAFAEALALGEHRDDPASPWLAQLGLGLLAHHRGQAQRARQLAGQALEAARGAGAGRARSAALLLLGHAGMALGDLAGAARAYEEVRGCAVAGLARDATAGLASLACARGDAAQAAAHVESLLPALRAGALCGVEEPAGVYLACYRVLAARRDPRAVEVLSAGHAFLQERAAASADAAARQRFLDAFPAHRELLHAWGEQLARAPIALDAARPHAYLPEQTAD